MFRSGKFQKLLGAAFAAAAIGVFAAPAAAWSPEKVTIVLPHGVGGGQDTTTRAFGKVWEKHLGAKIVFENVKGGSGRKGWDYFLSKPADGSYVLSTNLASASIMYAQQKPNWNWTEKVYAAGSFAVDPGAFFVRSDSPIKSMGDIVEMTKDKPQTIGLAFWASPDNLLVHQFMDITGAKLQVVPIGGGGDTVTSVLGGHSAIGYTKVANILKAGDQVRFLSVTMPKNPVKKTTGNAPTLNEVLGQKTISVASFRSIVVHQELVDKYPDRYKKIIESFEAAKDDPEYIAAAAKVKVPEDLIVDLDHNELTEVIQGYWEAFDKFGGIYKKQ